MGLILAEAHGIDESILERARICKPNMAGLSANLLAGLFARLSQEKDFTTREIQLKEGDSIYLFSDGFADQIGGPKAKKFLSKNFKRFLLEIQEMSMQDQNRQLNETLERWRKGYEQVDDILVMGIKI